MKISFFLLVVLLILPVLKINAAPEVEAHGAILMDGASGRVLWEKNSLELLPMASTTKVVRTWMTQLLRNEIECLNLCCFGRCLP